MQRKNWDAAEGEFQKSLTLDANNGEVDYFMGTVIASEKNPDKNVRGSVLFRAERPLMKGLVDWRPPDASRFSIM